MAIQPAHQIENHKSRGGRRRLPACGHWQFDLDKEKNFKLRSVLTCCTARDHVVAYTDTRTTTTTTNPSHPIHPPSGAWWGCTNTGAPVPHTHLAGGRERTRALLFGRENSCREFSIGIGACATLNAHRLCVLCQIKKGCTCVCVCVFADCFKTDAR